MTLHLLDTDTLTHYQRSHPTVVRNVSARPSGDVAVSVISVEEQLTGWYTRLRQAKRAQEVADVYERLAEAIRFLSRLDILGFPLVAAQRYEQLRKSHRGIGKNDL